MIRYYDAARERLAEFQPPGDPVDWDAWWRGRDPATEGRYPAARRIARLTAAHLPAGARVVDGGCGIGDKLWALDDAGFEAWGVDTAAATLARIGGRHPRLRLVAADILRMPFPDGFFDGYWSLGVIEHFRDGFDAALAEIDRVLAPDGCLFVSVPVMSPLRRRRAAAGAYPPLERRGEDGLVFWQYLLSPDRLAAAFARRGFRLVETQPQGGFYGIKDEVGPLSPALNAVARRHRSRPARLVIRTLNIACRGFAAHTALFVFRRGA